jgi:UDP-2,3-diacylglucosamine pyrophosphatase LpxH
MAEQPVPEPEARDLPYDCLVISDLHLGSDVCQARLLEEFLTWAVNRTRVLVINGDIFDDLNFKRLNKRHFNCLRVIRRNSDRDDLRVIWIRGNHDGPAEIVSHIVGVDILDEYAYDNGQVRLLILHGDQFDHFMTKFKLVTEVGCAIFYYIQKWAPHNTARWVRRTTKKWQRNSQLVMRMAVEYAKSKGYRYVTCGHTHLPMVAESEGVTYLNSGTWTEHPPCPFVSVRGGQIRLEEWPLPVAAEIEPPSRVAEPGRPGTSPDDQSIAPEAAEILR